MVTSDVVIKDGIYSVVQLMVIAAKTAPKGRGQDNLVIKILHAEDIPPLCLEMEKIGLKEESPVFLRDAKSIVPCETILLIGTKLQRLGLKVCGFCGYKDCETNKAAGAICSFNTGDLGIALGSAVSTAAQCKVDCRIMYTVGKAALCLKILGEEAKICYGIPLSVTSKNPFFDR